MTKTAAPLKVDQVIGFAPLPGVTIRLQRTRTAVFVVTVERSLLVDELRRSFATEGEARRFARALCLALRAGWTIERLVELASVSA
jgi:hypothetical protein